MTKEKLRLLTEALEGAGFEVVSMKEETCFDLMRLGAYSAFSSDGCKPPDMRAKTGIVALEIRECL